MKISAKPHPATCAVLLRSVALSALLLTAAALSLAPVAQAATPSAIEQKAPAEVLSALDAGKPQDLLVLFDDASIEAEAVRRKKTKGIRFDDQTVLSFRAKSYRELKKGPLSVLPSGEGEIIKDYSHLPLSFHHFRSRKALELLLARPEVVAVFENRPIQPTLTYSLPFIGQPATASSGFLGTGGTVAVIDTGINYTLPAFGSCSAPSSPAGCRVVASVDVTGNGVTLNTDPNNHGTNVAGIVAGVAPGARIAAVNAFSGGNSSDALVIDGINWAIANKAALGISALNMSLGDGGDYTSPCKNSHLNPYLTPIANARSAGILPVAAAGNSAFTGGISSPACTPGVVSVGAVYDANWGGPYSWGSPVVCTDSAPSAPDQIPCFSNSATFLTIMAPGAFITAAGIQMAGTSQASPHVAGAAALLRTAFPSDSLDQTVSRMTGNGVRVTDPRNGLSFPRLNLLSALGAPDNDNFASAPALSGDSGTLTAENANASKEPGEPNHAGNPGGKSVWWSWTPSAPGLASLDTHGSNFDTLLAVYTGTSVSALSQVAANDNDGSAGNTSGLTFTAQPGTRYLIAVDGFNGAFGTLSLNWSLTPEADLGISMTQSAGTAYTGGSFSYTLTVTSNGPAAATGVLVNDTLPAGATLLSASTGCTRSSAGVTCALGTLASGAHGTVQISVSPGQEGNLCNTATVTSDLPDPVSANNTATLAATAAMASESVPALSGLGVAGAVGLLLTAMAWEARRRRKQPPPAN